MPTRRTRLLLSQTLLLAPLLAPIMGCAAEYQPHPEAPLGLRHEATRTLGCIDVGFALSDPAHSDGPSRSLQLQLWAGNRCAHPKAFDAAAMKITAFDATGMATPLSIYDPRREITLQHLDASTEMRENLQLDGAPAADARVAICVDVTRIAPDAPDARPEPICLEARAEAEGGGAVKRAASSLTLATLLAVASSASGRGKNCVEVSEIVGYQQCRLYGEGWSSEATSPVSIEVSALYLGFAPAGHIFGAHEPKSENIYQFNGDALGSDRLGSFGLSQRIIGFVFPSLYIGMEGGFGFGHAAPPVVHAGGWTATPSGGTNIRDLNTSVLAGVRLPLGRVSARAELLLGVEGFSLHQEAVKGTSSVSIDATALTGLVEPRVAADVWLTPWVTLSGWYGRNLVDQGSTSVGLTFALHGRSYDGAFSF